MKCFFFSVLYVCWCGMLWCHNDVTLLQLRLEMNPKTLDPSLWKCELPSKWWDPSTNCPHGTGHTRTHTDAHSLTIRNLQTTRSSSSSAWFLARPLLLFVSRLFLIVSGFASLPVFFADALFPCVSPPINTLISVGRPPLRALTTTTALPLSYSFSLSPPSSCH